MLLLKNFTDLIFSLFVDIIPFYRKIKSIMDAFWDYSPNVQTNLTMESKSSILWIILMQERRFLQGNMNGKTLCLGEFDHMVNHVKEKICKTISHVEFPTDLLLPSRIIQSVNCRAVKTERILLQRK